MKKKTKKKQKDFGNERRFLILGERSKLHSLNIRELINTQLNQGVPSLNSLSLNTRAVLMRALFCGLANVCLTS